MASKNSDFDRGPISPLNSFFKNRPSCRELQKTDIRSFLCGDNDHKKFPTYIWKTEPKVLRHILVTRNTVMSKRFYIPECLEKQVVLRNP